MLSAIVAIFGSTGFGTVIGLLGSAFTRWDERQKQAQEFEQNFKLAQLSIEELKLEQAHELAVVDKEIDKAEVESEIVVNEGELSAFKTSLIEGNKKSAIRWVEGFNSLMRPLITLFFLGVVTWLTVEVHELVGGLDALTHSEIMDLYVKIIATILFLTATSVTWWFGARPSSDKKGKK